MATCERRKGPRVDPGRKAESVPNRRNQGPVSHQVQVGSGVCREDGVQPSGVRLKWKQAYIDRVRAARDGDPIKGGPSVARIQGRLGVALTQLSRPNMCEAASEEVARSVQDIADLAGLLEVLAFDLAEVAESWSDVPQRKIVKLRGESNAT